MGVTFRKYEGATAVVRLNSKDLKRTYTSKSQLKEIKGRHHILIPMGKKGPFIVWSGPIIGESDYNTIDNWNDGDYIYVVSSDYPELVAGEKWYIDKITTSRVGGSVNTWDLNLTIIKMWS